MLLNISDQDCTFKVTVVECFISFARHNVCDDINKNVVVVTMALFWTRWLRHEIASSWNEWNRTTISQWTYCTRSTWRITHPRAIRNTGVGLALPPESRCGQTWFFPSNDIVFMWDNATIKICDTETWLVCWKHKSDICLYTSLKVSQLFMYN